MKPKKILLIEDNQDLSDLLAVHFKDLNYEVEQEYNGKTGYMSAQKNRFDLIILDIMLPEINGMDILRKLRSSGNIAHILMLTSKSSELDRVLGLELGADDYIVKPFSIRELLARVKAIFRRLEILNKDTKAPENTMITAGKLTIFPDKRVVELSGREVEITAKEFDLLIYFASSPGRAYSRTQLLDNVWGYAHSGYEHTVNSHINRLRAKIEKDPANPRYILTVWGVGYKFTEEFST